MHNKWFVDKISYSNGQKQNQKKTYLPGDWEYSPATLRLAAWLTLVMVKAETAQS